MKERKLIILSIVAIMIGLLGFIASAVLFGAEYTMIDPRIGAHIMIGFVLLVVAGTAIGLYRITHPPKDKDQGH